MKWEKAFMESESLAKIRSLSNELKQLLEEHCATRVSDESNTLGNNGREITEMDVLVGPATTLDPEENFVETSGNSIASTNSIRIDGTEVMNLKDASGNDGSSVDSFIQVK